MAAGLRNRRQPTQSDVAYSVNKLFSRLPGKDWIQPFAVAICLCWLVIQFGPTPAVDQRVSDRLLAAQQHPATQQVVLVEITPEDVRLYGRPYMYRDNLARLLTQIEQAGARRTLLDIHVGDSLDPTSEITLERAIASFGRDRIAMVSGVLPQDRPLDHIARHATIIDGRLTPDRDGWHRALERTARTGGENPAIWLARGTLEQRSVPLDLRVDHTGFRRLSAREVLDDPQDLSGHLVIVGVGPDVAPTRAFLPYAPTASRAGIQAMAVQSELTGYRQRAEIGGRAERMIYALAFVFGLMAAMSARTGRGYVLSLVAAGGLLLALDLAIVLKLGVAVHPTRVISCLLVVANVMIAHRLRIVPMVASFVRGDISPDEAWAWRAHEESTLPTILFAADGSIKRFNPAAHDLVRAHGPSLALQCLPRIGERADEIAVRGGDGMRQPFSLDWPYRQVPIAVFRDQSEIEAMERTLREQLYVDELTGVANRRGFDRALAAATADEEGYHLYFIDLNGFKQVNDTHGHDAGDEVLVTCAARLARIVRGGDLVARLGGDEFGVLLATVGEGFDPAAHGERIVEALSQPIRLQCAEATVAVGAAVGHASPAAGESGAEVVRRADLAMYRRKAQMKGGQRPLAA